VRKAKVYQKKAFAGVVEEIDGGRFRFTYDVGYSGPPVSLTMPSSQKVYEFEKFPPLFEGLLPEGIQLEALLRGVKIDRNDLFGQLLSVGGDVIGSLRIIEDK
jgi:serine/threonine-protein kinase HipA